MNPSDIDPTALQAMSLVDLRALWAARYGPSPSTRSPEILAHMLAWRVQAERDGGLTPELRRQLRRPGAAPVARKLTPGTRLTREWQGQVHEVVVEPDGRFRHDGRLHRSLSQAPEPSPAPAGTGRGSSACATRRRELERQTRPLRHLHPQELRGGARSGVQ